MIIQCDLYDILSSDNSKQMAHFVLVFQDNLGELVSGNIFIKEISNYLSLLSFSLVTAY